MNVFICPPDKEASLSLDVQAPVNPFDCLKSEDEEEELTAADRQEEDDLIVAERQEEEELSAMERREEEEEEIEEVDEAELEAFLNGQLAERLLQESAGSRQGIAIQSEESMEFSFATSKAEEALHTCRFLQRCDSLRGDVHK